MSIFDINLYQKAVELMPVDKRKVTSINYLWGLLYPLQQDQERFLNDYLNGTTGETPFSPYVYPINYIVIYKQIVYIHLIDATQFPQYNSADTYTFGQGVVYDNIAYLCNVNSTTGSFHLANWTIDMPPSPNWQVYLPSFLGASQRVLFSGQYLTLTYALNDYYNDPATGPCHFRQPGLYGYASTNQSLPGGGLAYGQYSDIYITLLPYVNVGFFIDEFSTPAWVSGLRYGVNDRVIYNKYCYSCVTANNDTAFTTGHWRLVSNSAVFGTGSNSSSIGESTASDGIGEDSYPFLQVNNFQINVLQGVYNKTTPAEIAQFVNKIVPAGITFTIKPYTL